MPKGFISKDYVVLVIVAGAIAVLLMGAGFFSRPADWVGWVQATGLIIGMMVAVAVPGIQRSQEAAVQRKAMRDGQIGYARRMQYLCGELSELLGKINLSLNHLRATDRHRMKYVLENYLHRLFESHKHDLNDDRVVIAYELRQVASDLIDELESGRSDRVVFMSMEKRLQKLAHRCQVNAAMAERL
ncbi:MULTISPECIES: hypothetical protein [Pseudomonas]|uniref:5-bromo-4-chloroindolyl phosphate hydrolysis protein n=1 Tax=Pseudomonas phytophila TaxID=2867264 RepID=A0ABY6FLG9_9PSED|nr:MULTISPECIES: hypothetical protein [Pseudomonas]MCQ2994075.1 hypothetical protein [Pseudomonas syringae]MCD5986428.1 hypothetical protein [Pseudomonas quasicaspiana]MCQ2998866.1 hypothetical protein [Pseudomonas syringae]MDG6403365.1 hypothetical protein [Pseudomonas quasicaspiana]MDU8358155.1 hypothetical protein [Pseudomonas syringae group sp. J309-1]